jgi:[acyl-carrier-protein] S-malonyltransferase
MSLDPRRTAFVCPGQGSQSLGMGQALAETYPVAAQVFRAADELLGFALSRLAWEGPEATLNDTLNTQPALLVHTVAALRVFGQVFPGFIPAYVAGHSMGELSALVAAGALEYPAALSLVRLRGQVMKAAGETAPGGMAAILGLDIPTLEALCTQASTPGEVVQIANDNCPGQVVISGAQPALERALQLARAAGARRAVPLAVSIAAHSVLMEPALGDFTRAVEAAPIKDPTVPVIGNVGARPLLTAADIRADVQAQLNQRVRWTESIQWLLEQGITTFIELGSGNVLSGLIKRIDRQTVALAFGAPEHLAQFATAT